MVNSTTYGNDGKDDLSKGGAAHAARQDESGRTEAGCGAPPVGGGICVADGEGMILFADAALHAIWGYDEPELIGGPVAGLLQSAACAVDAIAAVRSCGRFAGRLQAKRKDGSIFDLYLSAGMLPSRQDQSPSILLSCFDLEERHAADEALRRRQALQRAVSGISSRLITLHDIDTAIEVSLADLGRASGACRVGLVLADDDQTLIGTTHEWCADGTAPLRGMFQQLDRRNLPWWMTKAFCGETVSISMPLPDVPDARQTRMMMKSRGSSFLQIVPLHMGEKIVGWIALDKNSAAEGFCSEDIALLRTAAEIIGGALERKQYQVWLQDAVDLNRVALDSLSDMVFIIDADLRFVLANESFLAWMEELELEKDVIGKKITEAAPLFTEQTGLQYERVIRTGRPLHSENIYSVDGRELTRAIAKLPIHERGRVCKIITVIRDITRQKELEELKIKAYSQIERNMEQFAILADHVRNPLQVIQAVADLMEDNGADRITDQVQRINHIINQLDERWAESRKLSSFWRKYA
ncbi:MAG: PAS domain S-box protein [Methanomicrobiaceae archaeon]|nr:PAS domain S-box protein [Methanomicrobiaceae archaeon]